MTYNSKMVRLVVLFSVLFFATSSRGDDPRSTNDHDEVKVPGKSFGVKERESDQDYLSEIGIYPFLNRNHQGQLLTELKCAPGCVQAYVEAFDLMRQDRTREAIPILHRTLEQIDEPVFLYATSTLLELAVARTRLIEEDPSFIHHPSQSDGRFSFVLYSTLAGVGVGALAGTALDIPDTRSNLILMMSSIGTGFGASMLFSRERPMQRGLANSYATGIVGGAFAGWNSAGMFSLSRDLSAGITMASMALGGTMGYVGAQHFNLRTEQSAMLSSTLAWGGVIGLMLLPVFDSPSPVLNHGLLLGGGGAGLLSGIAILSKANITPERVVMVNIGGLLGGLALGGLAVAVLEEQPRALAPRIVPSMTSAGIMAGFALTLLITGDSSLNKAEVGYDSSYGLLRIVSGTGSLGLTLPLPLGQGHTTNNGGWVLPLVNISYL